MFVASCLDIEVVFWSEEDENGCLIGGSIGMQFTDWEKILVNARQVMTRNQLFRDSRAFSTELPKRLQHERYAGFAFALIQRARPYDLWLHGPKDCRYLDQNDNYLPAYMYSWFGSMGRSDTITEPSTASASFSRRAVILKGSLAKVEASL